MVLIVTQNDSITVTVINFKQFLDQWKNKNTPKYRVRK